MSINKRTALEDQMQNYNDKPNLTYTVTVSWKYISIKREMDIFNTLLCFSGNISHLKLAISSSSVLVSSN